MSDNVPPIRTTTVGSYPLPDWLAAFPGEQALIDATRVVVDIQRQAGIDLPTDGELYRFDVNHPETNGMIDYFVRPLAGVRSRVGLSDWKEFAHLAPMGFRRKPAGVVEGALGEGALNLPADCSRAVAAAGRNLKFTLTSPFMLARTLLDRHYGDFEALTMALAGVLAAQVAELECAAVQVDEANLPGSPEQGPLAARAINALLDAAPPGVLKAVHLCFGNYGGQSIQRGTWKALLAFLNELRADHLVLEAAHRRPEELEALKEVRPSIALGIGVVDIKVNHVESAEEVARRIEQAERTLGAGRVRWVHPDCGFWMLKRSVADRKIDALVEGRNLYLGAG